MGNSASIDNVSQIRRVLLYTLVLNAGVSLAKIIYGYMSNSIAMTSDGFHSLFDGVSNIVGLIGIWIAYHPPDENHPYGHKKYETLFTIIIGVMIFIACFQILKQVYHSIVEFHRTEVTTASFAVMLITMGINAFVAVYESRKGKELKSEFLIADALHTKSDILVSVAVIASLIFTRAGYRFADALVGIVIAFLIARIGYEIIKRASDVLVDTICIDTTALEGVIKSVEGVKGCHDIRTRGTERSINLDVHILVNPKISVEKAHEIADSVEEKIKTVFPSVLDIVVHIEPEGNDCK
ncbi:MAG: cation transporter [Nitrospirae bacterium CG_4_10_14_3_um_filter_44_29]|nr:cation transporter [Nitrospirota bacterium]PIP69356.1 MAG: cation-efflux pump [Nitrospirae bacterium CG22_combo_CG10-13_8_21_14_all_44_11]PIV41187.1 MAG: cation transporter [Nitrospirae bacterium CG02_land_8_20_14_3_00_44_33]PIV66819.1 MAG: cation transporter [Nitrospirae bacterium CG01_land_8_20_14_3_00_44_22]PIW89858.1 MAG: cation transporter [Nitrospirae bacterium CG_4_8_14_3_um_filter_44_28]PIX87644.1 MAG: cation transporter [Nitrospirae bacterium CG_4_10_14_3_um_filter_44_29]PJA83100.